MLPRSFARVCWYIYGRVGSGRLLVEAIFSSCEERKEGKRLGRSSINPHRSLSRLIEFFNLPRPVDKSRARLRLPRGDINIPPPPREKFDIRRMWRRIGREIYGIIFSEYNAASMREGMVLYSIEGKEIL